MVSDYCSEWELKLLGEVADVIDPQPDHRAPKEVEGGYSYVGVGDFNSDGSINFDKTRRVSLEAVEKQEASFKIENGDIAFGKVGTIGNPRLLKYKTRYALSATLVLIKSTSINNKFLYYVLQSEQLMKQVKRLTTGSTRPTIGILKIRELSVPIPTNQVQRKIAAILTSVDNALEKTEAIIKQTEIVKQGLMQRLFTKGIGHTKFNQTEIGEIPYNWELAKIGEISSFIDYRGKTPVKTEQGVRLLTAKNVRIGYISDEPTEFIAEQDYESWMTRGIPSCGDILLTTEAPMGNVAQLNISGKVAFAQRVIIMQPNNQIDKKFMMYVLMSDNVQGVISLLSTGTTVKGIKSSNLKKVVIPIPPLDEQIKIAEILSSIDLKISIENRYLKQMSLVKKALLENFLTGKVRVNVDEHSEVSV